jgi:hypothetical protein
MKKLAWSLCVLGVLLLALVGLIFGVGVKEIKLYQQLKKMPIAECNSTIENGTCLLTCTVGNETAHKVSCRIVNEYDNFVIVNGQIFGVDRLPTIVMFMVVASGLLFMGIVALFGFFYKLLNGNEVEYTTLL